MSENAEVSSQKSQENEQNATKKTDGDTEKKLKRNYCYVCKIQCTASKNFLEHQTGKRHLKKLSSLNEGTKKKSKPKLNTKNKKASSSVKGFKSFDTDHSQEKNSKESELSKATASGNSGDHSNKEDMSNSKKRPSKHKKNQYSNCPDSYSRNHNPKYSYSNNYSGSYYYNGQQYPSYSRWRASHYPNDPYMYDGNYNNNEFMQRGQYDRSYENEYFSTNANYSYDFPNQPSHLSFNLDKSKNSPYNFFRGDEFEQNESNSSMPSQKARQKVNSQNSHRSSSRDSQNLITISTDSDQKNDSTSDLNHSSSSLVDKEARLSPTKSQSSDTNEPKTVEKKRLRTRSLGSNDSLNSDKKSKEKNEGLDSDGASEEQKLKDYTTSLLEKNPFRISLMIQHPSSHKEKAVLNHIMTSFSKTKRIENLTRKLRTNSVESTENNEDCSSEIQILNDEEAVVLLPQEPSGQTSLDAEKSKNITSAGKHAKSSVEINLDPDVNNKDSNNSEPCVILLDKPSSKKPRKVSVLTNKADENMKEKSCVNPEKPIKRKNSNSDSNNKVKKRLSGKNVTKFDVRNESGTIEQNDLNNKECTVENMSNALPTFQADPVLLPEAAPVKDEMVESADINETSCASTKTVTTPPENQIDLNAPFSVESLVALFASGNVAVKKEYHDPVIEAIKQVDPNELIKACSSVDPNELVRAGSSNSHLSDTNNESPTPLAFNTTSESNTRDAGSSNCINPVILGSAIDSDNITPISRIPRSSSVVNRTSSFDKSKDQSSSTLSGETENKSLSDVEKMNLITRTKTEFPHLIELIDKLQEIACKEEEVKNNLTEAKSKITEYSSLLEEWKNKKKKLQTEEEDLRKKRNDIIQLMQNAIKVSYDGPSKEEPTSEFIPETHSTPTKSNKELNTDKNKVDKNTAGTSSVSPPSSLSEEIPAKKRRQNPLESTEILILPPPVKPQPEIIVIDDTEESPTKMRNGRSSQNNRETISLEESQGPSFYDVKDLTVHSTVINSIVVFEGFVYTCSNDNTAKRFNLKCTSEIITYLHNAKNVTEIVVEKVQSEALVFTSCSNRVLSLFIASNGTKIKSFFQPSIITTICKGWGKFYAGIGDGTLNVYNWKYEEKEIVKTESPAYRIATTHQGRLHILVILTSDGDVILRDAETSLLIRTIKASVKIPSYLAVHNEFAYLSSSDRSISILDISSGRVERKIYCNSHPTGLAVHDDHIFTISYNGNISCICKDKIADKKILYGAGKNSLTCIHVYQNWVFTGNRKGDISVVHFNPSSRFACKFGNCNIVFGSSEDFEFHIEKDHLKKSFSRCHWGKCPQVFQKHCSMKEKISHVKRHLPSFASGSSS